MPWWQIIGWTGSALVVLSLIVPNVRRFRWLNLAGSLIATVYNIAFGIWPYAAMNAVITVIDAYWLIKLYRAGDRAYDVRAVEPGSELVAHFVERHHDGIQGVYPALEPDALQSASTFLTLCDDEVVGLFAMTSSGEERHVLIDYVTERFRDLTPGHALYAAPVLVDSGVSRLVVDPKQVTNTGYFEKQGFESRDGMLVRSTQG